MGINISLASLAEAVQIRVADNNAEIFAVISAAEVSRIALDQDRIVSVSTVPQGFSIDHDETNGDLFLVPLPGTRLFEPVNLFITSEAGLTYQLLLEPRDIPSEQILIRNPKNKIAKKDKTAPYRQEIAHLIRAVIRGDILDDYGRQGASADDIIVDRPDLVPVEIWHGENTVQSD